MNNYGSVVIYRRHIYSVYGMCFAFEDIIYLN